MALLSTSIRRVGARLTLTAALLATVAALAPAAATARTDNRLKAVALVHGLHDPLRADEPPGWSCEVHWAAAIGALRERGWTNTLHAIRYYRADDACDQRGEVLDGRPSVSSDRIGGYGVETSIRTLARRWAWWAWREYAREGRTLDVVAHSMGGLVVRYALDAVERGRSGYPPSLRIEDVVTLGTPHGGSLAAEACGWRQCREMRVRSSLISYLGRHARNPQGTGGTQWTVIGSNRDVAVPSGSALAMDTPHRIKYIDEPVDHFGLVTNARRVDDATFEWWSAEQRRWISTSRGGWPLAETELALVSAVN